VHDHLFSYGWMMPLDLCEERITLTGETTLPEAHLFSTVEYSGQQDEVLAVSRLS
jgi:hypothetical protein